MDEIAITVKPSQKPARRQRKTGDIGAPLTDLIAFRLIHIADLISRGAALVFEREFGISNAELRALIALGETQPLTIADLSRRARIDKAWVSRSMKHMLDRGLVLKSDHPTDSRMSFIRLTPRGEEMVARIAPVAWGRQKRLLGDLSEDTVLRIVTELERNAQELLKNP